MDTIKEWMINQSKHFGIIQMVEIGAFLFLTLGWSAHSPSERIEHLKTKIVAVRDTLTAKIEAIEAKQTISDSIHDAKLNQVIVKQDVQIRVECIKEMESPPFNTHPMAQAGIDCKEYVGR